MRRPPWHVLLRCLLRTLFLQAAFNPRTLQGVGFAAAVRPALAYLYPNRDELRAAMKRHLEPFGTHPYLAPALVGGTIHHEARVASGEASPESVRRFKEALAGPLAAIGDAFFWGALRPLTGALAALLALGLGVWGIVLATVLYAGLQLPVRVWLFRRGLSDGDGVLAAVQSLALPRHARWLRPLATFVAVLAGVAWVGTWAAQLGYPGPLIPVVAIGGAASTLPALRKGLSPYLALLLGGAWGGILGLVVSGGIP